MTAPRYRHMALASLVSAFAWVDSSINRALRGKSYSKYYLHEQRDAVLAHPAMVGALNDALTGKPDEGSTKKRYNHNWKDLVPTALETARLLYGKEEMPSKYLSFCAATAGGIVGAVIGAVAMLVAVLTLL